MYENLSYEILLERMLERVREAYPEMDTREGSAIFTALAPAAVEMKNMYIAVDDALGEAFADTASREYLILRAAERGISPRPATKAIRQGEFNRDVPIGARFGLNTLNYVVLERREDGYYRLECETEGRIGNMDSGTLVPVEYIDGLEYARLTAVLVPGEDEEDTEAFRKRYLSGLNSQAFGGNKADYLEKAGAIAGVGGVKVYPVWDGPGTVRLCVQSSEWKRPSDELALKVQNLLDPDAVGGLGEGLAPIGHRVTVSPVAERPVTISLRLVFQEGWAWEDQVNAVKNAAETYFSRLAALWAEEQSLIVRMSEIEILILALPGVLDVDEIRLNGLSQNLSLLEDEIPVLEGVEPIG